MVGQIGVTLNVPIQRARRDAAVRQATATTVGKRAELDRLVYEVRFRVHEAYERVNESRRVVRLFEEKLVPSARLSVQATAAAYETGKLDFLRLVEAQRKLIDLETERATAIGEYHVRWAELERAVGGLYRN
jgi:outer membrane protein TolC